MSEYKADYRDGLIDKLAELVSDVESEEVKNLLMDLDNVITEYLERIEELEDSLRRIRELTSNV